MSQKGRVPEGRLAFARRVGRRMLRLLGLRASDPPPPKPGWREIPQGPAQGVQLFVNVGLQELVSGHYDEYIFEAVRHTGCRWEGATCWDVGAHVGFHSLAFAKLVGPAGRVVAFEPNQVNRERMRMHLERNSTLAERIVLLPFALADHDGETRFIFSRDVDGGFSACSHLDQGQPPGDRVSYVAFEETRVETRRADSLMVEKGIPPPTLIKIDVEGAEVALLKGAELTLRRHRPTLAIEIHNIHAMYYAQRWLSGLDYEVNLVADAPFSHSRCFVVAHSRVSGSAPTETLR